MAKLITIKEAQLINVNLLHKLPTETIVAQSSISVAFTLALILMYNLPLR